MQVSAPRVNNSVWQIPALGGLEVLRADFVRHSFPKHSHETFTVVLIDRGASTYWYRGANRSTGVGEVSLLNPDEVHTGSPAKLEGYAQRSLYLEPARFWNGSTLRFFRGSQVSDAHLRALVSDLHDAIASQADELELTERLSAVTEWLTHFHTDARPAKTTPLEPGIVRRLRELLEDDPASTVNLELLANQVGSSVAHLSRAFGRAHGLPPHAYRSQLRIERAKARLLPGVSHAQLALELGFSSQSHFVTQFKRFTGVTPGHYSSRSVR
jgi:AraC-like DNA-binding protein